MLGLERRGNCSIRRPLPIPELNARVDRYIEQHSVPDNAVVIQYDPEALARTIIQTIGPEPKKRSPDWGCWNQAYWKMFNDLLDEIKIAAGIGTAENIQFQPLKHQKEV
jgi:hypothetical protein